MFQSEAGYINGASQLYQEISGKILESPTNTRLYRISLYYRPRIIAFVIQRETEQCESSRLYVISLSASRANDLTSYNVKIQEIYLLYTYIFISIFVSYLLARYDTC